MKVDAAMQVLDEKGRVMLGPPAVGNNAGSFNGMVYPPQIEGSGIGRLVTFACLAAMHVAAQSRPTR